MPFFDTINRALKLTFWTVWGGCNLKQIFKSRGLKMNCPKCGSENVTSQTFQENLGTSTISKTKSRTKTVGHGVLYWIFLGWWIWLPKLILWIIAFPFMLILRLFRKKKTKGSSTTVESTVNNIQYKTVYTCADCGNSWSTTSN